MKAWIVAAFAFAGIMTPLLAANVDDGLKTKHQVGFMRVSVPDPKGPAIQTAIWYPTSASTAAMRLGPVVQNVAADAPVEGDRLPFVVISHGQEGWFASHVDTALALADAGFVVAAPLHTGDNVEDQSDVGGPQWFADRSRHISAVIDYALKQWSGRAHIDPTRIGIFGFSAGGTTALIAIGGRMQFDVLERHCAHGSEFACSLWKGGELPDAAFVHDARIKAAVIAAPGFGFGFVPDGLSDVKVPVQLWGGEADQNVPVTSNVEPVREALGSKAELHLVPGAAHFSFIVPCKVDAVICRDPQGFDRVTFHNRFNVEVVRFFSTKL